MVELRHLRYFTAVAEELHFGRASERLHIEQSPLSRAIKDLEVELGVRLFDRTTRATRLTWAGQVFLEDARRVFSVIEGARARVRAAAAGFHGHLRIGISDGVVQHRLTALLLKCRHGHPAIQVQMLEMSYAQQMQAIRNELIDAGLAFGPEGSQDIVATPVWTDPLSVVLPAHHPLAEYRQVTLVDALRYPLILCHPTQGSGCRQQIVAMLATIGAQPIVSDQAVSLGVMPILVGAGYGIGFAVSSEPFLAMHPTVTVRPLEGRLCSLTTYLLHRSNPPSEALRRFIELASQDAASASSERK